MSTLGTMVDRISREMRRPDMLTEIEEAIRLAIDLHETDPMPWTLATFRLNTVANQTDYDLPEDLLLLGGGAIPSGESMAHIVTVIDRTGAAVGRQVHAQDWAFLELYKMAAAAGTPTVWARQGDVFRVGPKPSGVLTLYLTGFKSLPRPSALTTASDWLTAGKGEALIRGTARLILARDVLMAPPEEVGRYQGLVDQAYGEAKRRLAGMTSVPYHLPAAAPPPVVSMGAR